MGILAIASTRCEQPFAWSRIRSPSSHSTQRTIRNAKYCMRNKLLWCCTENARSEGLGLGRDAQALRDLTIKVYSDQAAVAPERFRAVRSFSGRGGDWKADARARGGKRTYGTRIHGPFGRAYSSHQSKRELCPLRNIRYQDQRGTSCTGTKTAAARQTEADTHVMDHPLSCQRPSETSKHRSG